MARVAVKEATEAMDYRLAFGLPETLGAVLALLMKEKIVTIKMLEKDTKLASNAKVTILRLRGHMEKHNIEISSMRRGGYWIDTKARERVKAMIKARVQ